MADGKEFPMELVGQVLLQQNLKKCRKVAMSSKQISLRVALERKYDLIVFPQEMIRILDLTVNCSYTGLGLGKI